MSNRYILLRSWLDAVMKDVDVEVMESGYVVYELKKDLILYNAALEKELALLKGGTK